MDDRQHKKKSLKERYKLTKSIFAKLVGEKLIMIEFWKGLKNALSKFLELKRATSLK